MAKRSGTDWTRSNDGNTASTEPLPQGFKAVSVGFALSKPGDSITGKYVGPGDPKVITKGKPPVNTFNLDTDGGRVNLLGAAQIDQFFSMRKKGDVVFIRRGESVKGGKGRVNTYTFAVK